MGNRNVQISKTINAKWATFYLHQNIKLGISDEWLSAILWWLSSYTCTFTKATQDMIVQKEYCLSHTQCITEYYYNIVFIITNILLMI